MTTFHGTKHDDTFDESSDTTSDTFDLYKGGNDTVKAGSGNDHFNMGASLNAGDHLDGGDGKDVLLLNGDYSAGVTFNDLTIQNIEVLRLAKGFSYNFTLADGNVIQSQYLTINAGALAAGQTLTFDGSKVSHGHLIVIGGAGDDTLTGGDKADVFNLQKGGNDTAHGGDGNDIFSMGAAFTSGDIIDGGAGNDTLVLNGDYHGHVTTLSDTQITSVETLKFGGLYFPGSISVTGDVADGNTLTIDASGNTNRFILDLTGATSAAYAITGGLSQNNVKFADNYSSSDTIDFSATHASSIVSLNGLYAGTLALSNTTLKGVNALGFNGDHSYNVAVTGNISATTNDLSIGVGTTGAGDASFIDLTQATTSTYLIENTGAGSLTVKFGGNFTSSDHLWGPNSTGATTLELAGDYSSGLAFLDNSGRQTILGVSKIKLDDGFSYKLTMAESNGHALAVDASALTGTHTLNFDTSGDTGGIDTFTITGGAGDDTVTFGTDFKAGDTFNGGAGNDALSLNGDYSAGYTFGAGQLTSVETIVLAAGHSYDLATNNANVASGATMTIDGSALGSSDQLFFDGEAETDGHFAFIAGAGADVITGGKLSDTFDLSGSNGAFVSGFDGNDTFTVTTAASLLADSIDGNAGTDTLILNGDFSTQTAITFANVANIENLTLQGAANSYNLVLGGGGVEGSGTFTIDASAAAAAAIDLTNATTKTYAITGSGGDDTFKFGANFLATDTIDGGAGNDSLALSGGDDIVFGATTLTSVETLLLTGGSFGITTNDGNVASGKTLAVDASGLTGTDFVLLDASAETNGLFAITGGAGADSVIFGSHYSVSNTFDGGAGNDTLTLTNIKGTFNFADATISNVENLGITVADSFSASFKTTDANVAAGATMTVDFSGSGNLFGVDVSFDGSAEQDGHFNFIAPHNQLSASFTGGALSDSFTLPGGGDGPNPNTFNGGGGDDIVHTVAGTTNVNFYGGTGSDTLALTGGGTLNGNWVFLDSVENMTLDDHSWNITFQFDAMITAGNALTVDGTALTSTHTLSFDGSGQTAASFGLKGGAGNDTLIGGALADNFLGGNGADTLTGNGGADVFYFTAGAQSSSTTHDTITDFAAGTDHIFVPTNITGIFAVSGAVSAASIDSDLTALHPIEAQGATIVTVTGGDLNGHTLLVIDGNGDDIYTGGQDYVIDITGYTGTITTGDFI